MRRPKRPTARPSHSTAKPPDQISDEDRAERGGRQVERRRREQEAHIGEQRDEIEQRAEADRVDREQARIAQVAEHLPRRGGEPFGAHEIALARQQRADHEAAGEGQRRERDEPVAPADRVGQQAGEEPPAEAAEAGRRHVEAGDAGRLGGRPFLADIGDHDGEDRRQHEPLHEAQRDQRMQARREARSGTSARRAGSSRRRSRACVRARRRSRRRTAR